MADSGKVFISYARVDLPFVARMAAEMRASGVDLWLDTLDIPLGKSWDDEIEKALKQCSRFLVVLTPESVASTNVRDEINEAIERGVHIIPALLRPCEVPFRIKRLQRFDLSSSPDVEIKRLIGALVSGGQSLPPPPPRPKTTAAIPVLKILAALVAVAVVAIGTWQFALRKPMAAADASPSPAELSPGTVEAGCSLVGGNLVCPDKTSGVKVTPPALTSEQVQAGCSTIGENVVCPDNRSDAVRSEQAELTLERVQAGCSLIGANLVCPEKAPR